MISGSPPHTHNFRAASISFHKDTWPLWTFVSKAPHAFALYNCLTNSHPQRTIPTHWGAPPSRPVRHTVGDLTLICWRHTLGTVSQGHSYMENQMIWIMSCLCKVDHRHALDGWMKIVGKAWSWRQYKSTGRALRVSHKSDLWQVKSANYHNRWCRFHIWSLTVKVSELAFAWNWVFEYFLSFDDFPCLFLLSSSLPFLLKGEKSDISDFHIYLFISQPIDTKSQEIC